VALRDRDQLAGTLNLPPPESECKLVRAERKKTKSKKSSATIIGFRTA
jgi:hypothetical protein